MEIVEAALSLRYLINEQAPGLVSYQELAKRLSVSQLKIDGVLVKCLEMRVDPWFFDGRRLPECGHQGIPSLPEGTTCYHGTNNLKGIIL